MQMRRGPIPHHITCDPTVSIEWETENASEQIWTLWRKVSFSYRKSAWFIAVPACNLFTTPNVVEASWNVMAKAQKPEFVFQRNGRIHLNQRGRQFSRLLAAEVCASAAVEFSWNVMAQGDAREWKWRGNWRMEWVASTLHTTSEHGVSSITTADAHTSAASSRVNWRPRRFK